MYGYDTLVCAIGQNRLPDLDWQGVQYGQVGGVRTVKAWANFPRVKLSYHEQTTEERQFSEMRVEASLPKVLYDGSNARELSAVDEIREALVQVAASVESFTGAPVDLSSWDVRRVDITADRVLPQEAHVQAVLEALGRVRLRRKLPVRGQAGTISWPAKRGGFTRKAYSKYLESGEEAARGRLRVEVGCMGQKALRRVHPGPVVDGGQVVRVRDLLTDEAGIMRERVCAGMVGLVDKVIEEAVDVDAMRAFWAFKAGDEPGGPPRRSDYAGRMIGYAYLVQRFGWSFLDDVLGRATVWRVRREFQRVGLQPEEIEFNLGGGSAPSSLEELAETGDTAAVRQAARVLLDAEFPLPEEEE